MQHCKFLFGVEYFAKKTGILILNLFVIDENTEPSGTSVSVGQNNQVNVFKFICFFFFLFYLIYYVCFFYVFQFMYAIKNLNMKEPGFVAYALWAKEVRKTLMNAYPNFSKLSYINYTLHDLFFMLMKLFFKTHLKLVNNSETCGNLYLLKTKV